MSNEKDEKDILADIESIMADIDGENERYENDSPPQYCNLEEVAVAASGPCPEANLNRKNLRNSKKKDGITAKDRIRERMANKVRTSNIKDIPETMGDCRFCKAKIPHVSSRKCGCHEKSCPRYCVAHRCESTVRIRNRDAEYMSKNNVEKLADDILINELKAKERQFKQQRKELLEREKNGEIVEPDESKLSPMQLPNLSIATLRSDLHDTPVALPSDYFRNGGLLESTDQIPELFTGKLLETMQIDRSLRANGGEGLLEFIKSGKKSCEVKLLVEKPSDVDENNDDKNSNESDENSDEGKELVGKSETGTISVRKIGEQTLVSMSNGTEIILDTKTLDQLAIVREHNIEPEDLAVNEKNISQCQKYFGPSNTMGLTKIEPNSIKAGIIGGNKSMLVAIGPPTFHGQPGLLAAIWKRECSPFKKYPGAEEKIEYSAPYYPVRDEEDLKNLPDIRQIMEELENDPLKKYKERHSQIEKIEKIEKIELEKEAETNKVLVVEDLEMKEVEEIATDEEDNTIRRWIYWTLIGGGVYLSCLVFKYGYEKIGFLD